MTTMMILCLFCHCSCQLDTCLLAPFSSLAGLLSVTLVPYFSCCSFLTRTWLGCRSLAIIHLYFVFTQTPARIFLHPNTQNALPGWNPSTPDVGARPNPCLASLGQGGGGPLRGWMEGLYIFWTLHFLSSQLKFGPSCFAAVWPRDCRIALKEGGRQQKRCDFWPLLPRQAVHVFGQKC